MRIQNALLLPNLVPRVLFYLASVARERQIHSSSQWSPSLHLFVCHLVKFSRHVTSPNQGLSLSPRGPNRPFPSSIKSHFQSEAKCEAIDMKMSFNYDANKTHFHNKGFALSLVLKVRFFGTRKWPIEEVVLYCKYKLQSKYDLKNNFLKEFP